MRFIIMHRTNASWEAGARPSPELVARVGSMLGAMANDGVLVAAEGLRPSAQGVRLGFADGKRVRIDGPFDGGRGGFAGFSLVRARSLEDAIEWALRRVGTSGDAEIDIRPVTEPWDIGLAPTPANLTTRRYMVLHRAAAAGEGPAPAAPEAPGRAGETNETPVVPLVAETPRPGTRGRRYARSTDGVRVIDGPFTETKELIGGYVIVSVDAPEDADRWAAHYLAVVDAETVDVLELE